MLEEKVHIVGGVCHMCGCISSILDQVWQRCQCLWNQKSWRDWNWQEFTISIASFSRCFCEDVAQTWGQWPWSPPKTIRCMWEIQTIPFGNEFTQQRSNDKVRCTRTSIRHIWSSNVKDARVKPCGRNILTPPSPRCSAAWSFSSSWTVRRKTIVAEVVSSGSTSRSSWPYYWEQGRY